MSITMCHTTSQHPMACHIIHTVTAPNHSLPHVPYYYTLPCGTLQITATPSKLTVPLCKCTILHHHTDNTSYHITSHFAALWYPQDAFLTPCNYWATMYWALYIAPMHHIIILHSITQNHTTWFIYITMLDTSSVKQHIPCFITQLQ